eukprot:CAMPEP_0114562982 /NCGR_PEP_ID=MMETSP0114-20121206/12836_1 /TAXON_ID=31324 /ORGANISM="Goniomonas sp, Strain m" /LENGTH=259 /DNA_ID=CAMNT_0001748737 /DNA_START=1572 /DNA_END=2352 /DNA_ORIENTATION=-
MSRAHWHHTLGRSRLCAHALLCKAVRHVTPSLEPHSSRLRIVAAAKEVIAAFALLGFETSAAGPGGWLVHSMCRGELQLIEPQVFPSSLHALTRFVVKLRVAVATGEIQPPHFLLVSPGHADMHDPEFSALVPHSYHSWLDNVHTPSQTRPRDLSLLSSFEELHLVQMRVLSRLMASVNASVVCISLTPSVGPACDREVEARWVEMERRIATATGVSFLDMHAMVLHMGFEVLAQQGTLTQRGRLAAVVKLLHVLLAGR